MPTYDSFGSLVSTSLTEVWLKMINAIPSIVGALALFLIGVFIAGFIGRAVTHVIRALYVDRAVNATGLKQGLTRIGFKWEVSDALGILVTWSLYAVALIGASEILGLNQISDFLQSIVLYIPDVIIAIIILLVGVIISNFIHTLVKETATAAKLDVADTLANIAKWAILVFSAMAALIQLKVATELIQILFTGLVLMVALAGGIAFGLGGKDHAKRFLDSLTK